MPDIDFETTAILVDGAFYRRRAYALLGDKDPKSRAHELMEYCSRHLCDDEGNKVCKLYRIFYYDCPPMEGPMYHPLLQQAKNMAKSPTALWAKSFFAELANKRKVALRMGTLQERESAFRLKAKTVNKLFRGDIALSDITEADFEPDFVQKGVDMRIGLDIASLANKHQVSQIVLISGDSDFVPIAKHARREGIDFILDPMWQGIRPDLNEHIDGLHSCVSKAPNPKTETLHVDYHGSAKKKKQQTK